MQHKPTIKVMPIFIAENTAHLIKEPFAFLSITTPGTPKDTSLSQNENARIILRLRFRDTDDGEYTTKRKASEKTFAPLKDFADSVARNNIGLILVCCEGGISRSSGVACALCEYFKVPCEFWTHPFLHPNIRAYRLACKSLGIEKTQKQLEEKFAIRKACSALCGADPEKYPVIRKM